MPLSPELVQEAGLAGVAALWLCGGIAGTLGGLLGLGGGILLMPVLRFGLGMPPAWAAGTCILAVFFTTLGGAWRHFRLGHLVLRPLLPLVGAGVVASALFSLLFRSLAHRSAVLDFSMGLVFVMVAGRMLFEGVRRGKESRLPENGVLGGRIAGKVVVGAAAGLLPGLLGIGTGGILVPAFTFGFRTTIKRAAAASLACFCFTAAVSAAFKMGQGYVDLRIALPVCAGTLMGAMVGAGINHRAPSRALKLLFGLVFAYVSLKFLFSSMGVWI